MHNLRRTRSRECWHAERNSFGVLAIWRLDDLTIWRLDDLDVWNKGIDFVAEISGFTQIPQIKALIFADFIV